MHGVAHRLRRLAAVVVTAEKDGHIVGAAVLGVGLPIGLNMSAIGSTCSAHWLWLHSSACVAMEAGAAWAVVGDSYMGCLSEFRAAAHGHGGLGVHRQRVQPVAHLLVLADELQRHEPLGPVAMRDYLEFGKPLELRLSLAQRVGPVREQQRDLVSSSLDRARIAEVGHGRAAVVLIGLTAHLAQHHHADAEIERQGFDAVDDHIHRDFGSPRRLLP